jgi:hypothetical protein
MSHISAKVSEQAAGQMTSTVLEAASLLKT